MDLAFLGDSLTEGWPGAAYLLLLERRFPQHRLLNHGRAGDTVADLLLRMRHAGLAPVDVAFIWVGANDAVIGAWDASDPGSGWSWPERLARIRGDYDELVEWTAARTARLVLVRPIILEAEGRCGRRGRRSWARDPGPRRRARRRGPGSGSRLRRRPRRRRRALHHRRRALHGRRRAGRGGRVRGRHRARRRLGQSSRLTKEAYMARKLRTLAAASAATLAVAAAAAWTALRPRVFTWGATPRR